MTELDTQPDAELISWYANHKEQRKIACGGSNRSHYWNLNSEQKTAFLQQLCRQFGTSFPKLVFDSKYLRKYERDGRSVMYDREHQTIYTAKQGTCGKGILWAFYHHYWHSQYGTNANDARPQGDFLDPAESFAGDFWANLRDAVR